jgi:hypothetical protein
VTIDTHGIVISGPAPDPFKVAEIIGHLEAGGTAGNRSLPAKFQGFIDQRVMRRIRAHVDQTGGGHDGGRTCPKNDCRQSADEYFVHVFSPWGCWSLIAPMLAMVLLPNRQWDDLRITFP